MRFHRETLQYRLLMLCVAVFVLVLPKEAFSQMIIGDPSQTGAGTLKVDIGGGTTLRQQLKIDSAVVNVSANPNITWQIRESSEEVNTEQIFMKLSTSLGQSADLFGTIGQVKATSPIDGDYGTLIGGGVKLSSAQTGLIKIGFVLQAFNYSSEAKTTIANVYGSTANGSTGWVTAVGDGSEKLSITDYNAILGFGFNNLKYVRPYAGLLFSIIKGTDEVSFSGSGAVSVFPAGGGTITTNPSGPVSFSRKSNVRGDSSVNGFVGVTLNPLEQMGITLEGQFGNATSLLASGFIRF